MDTLINPLTHRRIKVGGPTYIKLNKGGLLVEGKSRPRSWKKVVPKPGKERRQVLDECGPKCFLLPKEQKFPICRKLEHRKPRHSDSCEIDCSGLIAAKTRASQHGYSKLLPKINKLQKKYCKNGGH